MRTVMLTLLAVVAASAATIAEAQVGRPASGLINQAATPLGVFRGTGPGWFYYGVNPADRGLGYNGSYMTVGGFIPYAEDDLGGVWAADVRGHLSEYGGFFSNVGAIRKQFIGGTVLGFGVYWDYDGDMDQNPTGGLPGTEVFGQFGHAYNQVGVSGEWLTDFGNVRSNGYIPVGSTAYTIGTPGQPFTQNFIMLQNGLDAAIGGADLEVGAYIPGLTDWNGMVSVGGYALGNSGYTWSEGTDAGESVVPWFGGVYTRLDMTLAQNWDFSLQANNDSYFDWTGFARLTYRMGGSRRRNVPDQVEQPMMRNEHIVRAHQTPVLAINPVTSTPWHVIHVDNTAQPGGTGTAEAPVTTLALAQAAATAAYDIVYVHTGNSTATPYDAAWQFQADNQLLIGEGSLVELNTLNGGYRTFFAGGGGRPVLTSTSTAIELRDGAVVDHFRIVGAPFGIVDNAGLTTEADVNDVEIVGTGVAGDAGIVLANVNAGAQVNFYNTVVQNMDLGLFVFNGAGDIDFQGLITNTNSPNASVSILNTTGGTINVNRTTGSLNTAVARDDRLFVPSGIVDNLSQFNAPLSIAGTADTTVNIGQARVTRPSDVGALVSAGNANLQMTFTNLRVIDSENEAFISESNDAASVVTIDGTSSLSSVSTTLPALRTNDDAVLNIALVSLSSGVNSGTNNAIVLQGTSTGFVSIAESFLVANPAPPPATVDGTVANDVTNATPVVVTVPP